LRPGQKPVDIAWKISQNRLIFFAFTVSIKAGDVVKCISYEMMVYYVDLCAPASVITRPAGTDRQVNKV